MWCAGIAAAASSSTRFDTPRISFRNAQMIDLLDIYTHYRAKCKAMTSPQHRHRVRRVHSLEILAALRQADGPVRVRELAEAVGLHPNSVREQLDQLVDAGLTIPASGHRRAGDGRACCTPRGPMPTTRTPTPIANSPRSSPMRWSASPRRRPSQ